MNNLPRSIDEVLQKLDEIILETIRDNNYLGIFAYVYRRTTAEIKKNITEKQFEDNERMERMDVTFANKYIFAYQNFKTSNGPVSKSWTIPFQSGRENLTIMQHLLMGMNAHKRPPGVLLGKVLNFISKFEEKEVKRIVAGLKLVILVFSFCTFG